MSSKQVRIEGREGMRLYGLDKCDVFWVRVKGNRNRDPGIPLKAGWWNGTDYPQVELPSDIIAEARANIEAADEWLRKKVLEQKSKVREILDHDTLSNSNYIADLNPAAVILLWSVGCRGAASAYDVWEFSKNGVDWIDVKTPGRDSDAAKSDAGEQAIRVCSALHDWAESHGLQVRFSRPCFNLILEGVPGTGKTFSLSELRRPAGAGPHHPWMAEWGQGRFAMTMHPATAYEDFVEGLRPGDPPLPGWSKDWDGCQTNPRVYRAHDDGMAASAGGTRNDSSDGDQDVKEQRWFFTSTTARATASDSAPQSGQEPARAGFSIHNGFFVRVCDEAVHFPDRIFVVLLDEINRCNIPKVMGDLLTTLEPSKRAKWSEVDGHWDITTAQTVTLPYSQRTFFVPDNVVVVGTMNTTDRSVAPMDAALRRRFAFARVHPQGFGAKGLGNGEEKNPPEALVTGVDDRNAYALETSWKLWKALNTALQQFGDDAMLGHSYLWDLKEALEGVDNHEEVWKITESRWNLFILPQLVDVLVSNDLVDEVLAVKDGKTGGVQFNDYIHTELRGTGLLRVPMFSVKGEKFKQPDASAEAKEGTPLDGTQNSEDGDTGAVPPES